MISYGSIIMTPAYIDAIAILVFGFMLWSGYRHGMWSYAAKLVSFIAGMYAGIMLFHPLGSLIAAHSTVSPHIASLIAFIAALVATQLALDQAFLLAFRRYPSSFKESRVTRVIALVPAALEAAVLIILLVAASPALPLPTSVSTSITDSRVGSISARSIQSATHVIDRLTSGRLSAALSELMTHPGSEELPRKLPFKPSTTHVDEAAEAQMLALLNEERAKVGAPALVIDPKLTVAARLHSEDMWERQYFAHETPEGTDPFARMTAAGARFLYAGENIALAPSTQLAHTGLMNSPGHKRNILDPHFRRVGLGIIDGGIYGKMFTQDFAD